MVVAMICSISYSQNSRIIVIGKDTFSLVPMRMVHDIIDTKIALMECDSLMAIGRVIFQEEQFKGELLVKKIGLQEEIIRNDSVSKEALRRDNQALLEDKESGKKVLKRTKVKLYVSGVANVVLAIVAILEFIWHQKPN